MQLDTILAMIVVYFGVTTAVGILMGRRSRSSEEWSIAGRQMGFAYLTFGIAATRVGGVSTYGVAGDVISGGVWNLWYAASAVLAMTVVGVFFARRYRRLGLHTIGELFYRRFGRRRCQSVASLCVQTEFFVINIIEPFIIAQILSTVTGMSFGSAVAIAALILISYIAWGGLWGSAATNIMHSCAMLVGLSAVAVAGMAHLGGVAAIVDQVNATLVETGVDPAKWWHPAGAGWLAVIGMLLAAVIHTPAISIWVNFSSAARDERLVVPSFVMGGVVAGAGSVLAAAIGIETLAKYGTEAQVSGYETLTRLAVELDPFLGGLAIAAVLAAVISSGGPFLLASATMLVRDWVPGASRWRPSTQLATCRVTTVLLGVVGATLAWLAPIGSVLGMILFAFAMVVPPAIAVAFVMYWRRTTEAATFWGIASGYAGGLLWYLLTQKGSALGLAADGSAWQRLGYAVFLEDGGLDPSYASTLIPLIVIPVLSLMRPQEAEPLDWDEPPA